MNTKNENPQEMVRLTVQIIKAGGTKGVGFRRKQVAILGVPYPLQKGWMERLAGTYVEKGKLDRYLHYGRKGPYTRGYPVVKKATKEKQEADLAARVGLTVEELRALDNHMNHLAREIREARQQEQ